MDEQALKRRAAAVDHNGVTTRGLRRSLRDESGMTLIEVLVASVVLLVGVLATFLLLDGANATTVKTRARENATNLMRELTEASRGVPYTNLTSAGIAGILAAQPGLQDDSAGGAYTIRRQGVTYTVEPDICIMDEPVDGGGDQSGGGFCPDSVAANTPRPGPGGATDSNPEDYKRVTVTVKWSERGRAYRQTQRAIINNPGSIAGPAIRSLQLMGAPASPPPHVTLGGVPGGWGVPSQRITVLFSTSIIPFATNWLLDGAIQKPVPTRYDGTGKTYSVVWDYAGLYDGTYVIGAEAYDKYGVAGPGRSLSVTLNRYIPAAPTNLAGGRNGDVVELEWSANKERDIIGYTVERETAIGTWAQVCPAVGGDLTSARQCVDTAPLTPGRYRVIAWDRAPDGTSRAGTPSDVLTVSATNNPPAPVENVSYVKNADGTVTITWTRPTDPDGDDIDFYRIYRDGTARGDRYDAWYDSGANITWNDGATGGLPHTYYVTAVDVNYAESAPVAVVIP